MAPFYLNIKRAISLSIVVAFLTTSLKVSAYAQLPEDQTPQLPIPGTMVNLSPAYEPVLIKGLKIHPDNPLNLDFIVDTGNSKLSAKDKELKIVANRLIKYFFASLTLPEKEVWVNLSPYEKNRIVPDATGQTEMGRDMLAEDYILKQVTASLIYPEKGLGKDFWNTIYKEAYQRYGVTQIPVNTFNKVWIVADKASVYEANDTVLVVDAHLKVMLEEDYLASIKHVKSNSSLASLSLRQIILPALEKEVNTGKNFATLRQIFHSLILAKWYKQALKTSLLNQVYSDKCKINGINITDKTIKEKIFQQYLKAYKKGVFNFIKTDIDQSSKEPIPRKYFSGGILGAFNVGESSANHLVSTHAAVPTGPSFLKFSVIDNPIIFLNAAMSSPDGAMTGVADLEGNDLILKIGNERIGRPISLENGNDKSRQFYVGAWDQKTRVYFVEALNLIYQDKKLVDNDKVFLEKMAGALWQIIYALPEAVLVKKGLANPNGIQPGQIDNRAEFAPGQVALEVEKIRKNFPVNVGYLLIANNIIAKAPAFDFVTQFDDLLSTSRPKNRMEFTSDLDKRKLSILYTIQEKGEFNIGISSGNMLERDLLSYPGKYKIVINFAGSKRIILDQSSVEERLKLKKMLAIIRNIISDGADKETAIDKIYKTLNQRNVLTNILNGLSTFENQAGSYAQERIFVERIIHESTQIPEGSTTKFTSSKLQKEFGNAIKEISREIDTWRPNNYPPGVVPHLDSHKALKESLLAKGLISTFDSELMDIFREGHDLGYSVDLTNPEFLVQAKAVWKRIADNLGYPDQSDAIAQLMTKYSDPNLPESYAVTKIIAHATTSIVPVMDHLKQKGFSDDQAFGLALIFAAHHCGFPITMVNEKVIKGIIPKEFWPILLITDNVEGLTNPDESLRHKIADIAANLLDITSSEARYYATLGYMLDRITAARMMKNFSLGNFILYPNDTYSGQIIWTGGETVKRYPLILTNMKNVDQLNLPELLKMATEGFNKEALAAITSGNLIDEGIEHFNQEKKNLLLKIAQEQSTFEITQTENMHKRILKMIETRMQPDFTGNLRDVSTLIRQSIDFYSRMPANDPDRPVIEYLLGILITLKTSPMAQKAIKALVDAHNNKTDLDQEIMTALQLSTLSEGFNEDELRNIIAQAPETMPVEFKAGQRILTQRDIGKDIYIIKSGEVNIVKDGVTIATRYAGEIIGEMAALFGTKRTADVIAAGDVTLIHLSSGQARRLIDSNMLPFLKTANERFKSEAGFQDPQVLETLYRATEAEDFVSKTANPYLAKLNDPRVRPHLDAIEKNITIIKIVDSDLPIAYRYDDITGSKILRISKNLLELQDVNNIVEFLDLMGSIHRFGFNPEDDATNQAVSLVKGYFEFLKDYLKVNSDDKSFKLLNQNFSAVLHYYREFANNSKIINALEQLNNYNGKLASNINNDEQLAAQSIDLAKALVLLFTAMRDFPVEEESNLEDKIDTLFQGASHARSFIGDFKKAFTSQAMIVKFNKSMSAQPLKDPGGIDLNAKNMSMNIIKKDGGIKLFFSNRILSEFRRGKFSGLRPIIVQITPISNLLLMLGINASGV